MTLSVTVERFVQEKIDENKNIVPDGTLKQNVTLKFKDTDIDNNSYIETVWLTIDSSKSDDDYVKEAYEAMKDNATAWSNEYKLVGKTFNTDTGKME